MPLILFGVSVVTFFLLRLVPVEPAEVILRLSNIPPTEEAIASVREELGTDRPLLVQYGIWVGEMCRLEFGTSFVSKEPIAGEIVRKFPSTLQLAMASLLLTLVISIPLGIGSALHPNGPIDRISRWIAFIGASTPRFWLGYILIYLFSLKLDIFPIQGKGSWLHLILPAFTLAFAQISVFARLLHSGIMDQMKEPYVLYARVRGLKERTIIVTHVLKTALLPVITALGISTGHLLGGTVIVEQIFGWPGLGRYLIESIINRDYPVIQSYALLMAVIFVVTNLLVDILHRLLDPRTQQREGNLRK
jgi:nickel ABC transporter permease subunit NikB